MAQFRFRKPYPAVTVAGTTPIDFIFSGALDFDSIGLQLVTTGSASGAWTVSASNNFRQNGADQIAATGTWDDCTSLLNAAPTAVATASDQYRQLQQFGAAGLKVTFTPAAGAGTALIHLSAKAT
jgi:hypothetical protein